MLDFCAKKISTKLISFQFEIFLNLFFLYMVFASHAHMYVYVYTSNVKFHAEKHDIKVSFLILNYDRYVDVEMNRLPLQREYPNNKT